MKTASPIKENEQYLESGAAITELALLIALVALMGVVSIGHTGQRVQKTFAPAETDAPPLQLLGNKAKPPLGSKSPAKKKLTRPEISTGVP